MIKSIASEIEVLRERDPEGEIVRLISPIERIYDDDTMTAQEQADAANMVLYELKYRQHQRGQKKALPLLRRYLTPTQRQDMRRRLVFTVVGSEGGIYQLAPHSGAVFGELVQKGKRCYRGATFCYHDPESVLPAADVALGQMLLIMTDEPKFLAEANRRPEERIQPRSAIPPRVFGNYVCNVSEVGY